MSLLIDEYSQLEFLDTHLKPDTGDGKLTILDVKVKTKSGRIIDIEIQVFRVTAFRSRMLFYMAQMIVQQINKGDPYFEDQFGHLYHHCGSLFYQQGRRG